MQKSFMFILVLGLVVGFTGSVWATPIEWNGHWYEAVYANPVKTWTEASAAAQAAGGYLATSTSAEENSFLYSLVSDSKYWELVGGVCTWGPWFGGYRVNDEWKWVTGEPWSYTNWALGEPTATENYIHFYTNHHVGTFTPGDTWNNLADVDYYVHGYIVEWNHDPSNPPVPVPGTLLLLSSGLLGLTGWRRFKKN